MFLIELLRPNSKYFQHYFNNATEEPIATTTTTSLNAPHLPSVTRRLNVAMPVMKTKVSTNNNDDTVQSTVPLSLIQQMPVRVPEAETVTSIPTINSRISNAVLRSSSLSTKPYKSEQSNAENVKSISPTLSTANNSQLSLSNVIPAYSSPLPIRRAEALAREAIQDITRFQQQRNNSISENNNQSPSSSRRLIINLKSNQSVSLDSRLSSAMKPPPTPSSPRKVQRNNSYHMPVLREIQMLPHPTTTLPGTFQWTSASNNDSHKNEFYLEIPVTVTTSDGQENQVKVNTEKQDGIISHERIPSMNNNQNQTLKSILKRSSSRETVSRKNVSFMNV